MAATITGTATYDGSVIYLEATNDAVTGIELNINSIALVNLSAAAVQRCDLEDGDGNRIFEGDLPTTSITTIPFEGGWHCNGVFADNFQADVRVYIYLQ